MNHSLLSTRPLILGALSVLTLFAAGCNKERVPAIRAGTRYVFELPSPDTVVATYGDRKITSEELEKEVSALSMELENEVRKQRYSLRKNRLDEMINAELLQAEATSRGVTVEQLLKAEVEDKLVEPPEAQLRRLYEQSARELPPGSTYETTRPVIIDSLLREQRDRRIRALHARLRKAAKVQLSLWEPRQQVEARGPSRGPDDAQVTIVEFADFECPSCGRTRELVEILLREYPGKVRVVFRQFPLSFHPNAARSAEASLCAHEQGRFWQYHDVLFENQEALGGDKLEAYAAQTGLDIARFTQCLRSGRYAQQVKEDLEAGRKVGVSGTPSFFINGIPLVGTLPLEDFKQAIEHELAATK